MQLEPSISFGNIVTLAVFIVGFAVAWSRIETRIGYIEKWVERAEARSIVDSSVQAETRTAWTRLVVIAEATERRLNHLETLWEGHDKETARYGHHTEERPENS